MSLSQWIALVGSVLLAPMALAAPVIENPSFEADRYGEYPGYASGNGGRIAGWQFTGNVGLNPCWADPETPAGPRHAFSDNGVIPHRRQVALMQNQCALSQEVAGFESGKKYRVTYHENARHYRRGKDLPRIAVLLGGETVVSEHAVAAKEPMGRHTLPYDVVESAVFTAPSSGAFDLIFKTTVGNGVTMLIDNVAIVEVAE